MLPLSDPRWQSYSGGYRSPYDPTPCIRQLIERGSDDELWVELWNELHHKGDVDQASYATVPWLAEFVQKSQKIDWNALALIATIELERPKNPPIKPELSESYFLSIQKLPEIIGTHSDKSWDELVMQAAAACIALARGQRWFARAYLELDHETAGRWFSEEFGWSFCDD